MERFTKKSFSRSLLIVAITILVPVYAIAQHDSTFVPHGKPFMLIFSDVNYTVNEEGNSKAFELTRAFFGYDYFFSKKISSKINIDLADPGVDNLDMTMVIRNAFVQYKGSAFSARIGMIEVDQFVHQQAQWGYRYIYKSFLDAYKFSPPADLGIAFEYSPIKAVSFDFSILNGEGYKKVELDTTFKTTFGITLKPSGGFVFRGYYDRMKKDFAQTTVALMAGYSHRNFRTGIEYNMQQNAGMADGNDKSGMSVYASLGISEKFSVFTRYDYLKSDSPNDDPETGDILSTDEQFFIAGFDYTPVKGIKIAPSYFGYVPDDNSKSFTSRVGIYLEVKF